MLRNDALLGALRAFVTAMASDYDLNAMAFELCESTTQSLNAAGAGVAVADGDGNLRVVTGTSERFVELEKTQERLQEGPCMTAYESQKVSAVGSPQELAQWSQFAEVAARLGVRSVLGIPLSAGDVHLGALNVYYDEEREWDDQELAIAEVLAGIASAYLVRSDELHQAKRLAEQLQTALDSRLVIEQAKGMISGEFGIDIDSAYQLLRSHARNSNLKLSEVSQAIVNLGLRLPRPKS